MAWHRILDSCLPACSILVAASCSEKNGAGALGPAPSGTDTLGGATFAEGASAGDAAEAVGPEAAADTTGCGTSGECPSSYGCFDGVCKPILCQPGVSYCEGLAMKKGCSADGTAFLPPEPCPEGMYCTSGLCGSSCAVDPKFGAYVGCAYWTLDLPQWADPTILPTSPEDMPHAVVISNPGELDAQITFEETPGYPIPPDPQGFVVKGGETRAFMMPVVNITETGITLQGIRFTSTRPILAHQFQPWEPIWSNDASLLLPETFLGSDYTILSWPTDPRGLIQFPIPGLGTQPSVYSYFTVVAPYADTQVTIQVTAHVAAGVGVLEMQKGALQTVTLQRGEVLNIQAEPTSLFTPEDLTGSTVSATKPVMVFAGQESALIAPPWLPPEQDTCCLDHLEEAMLPLSVLGTSYLAVKTKPRGGYEPDLWRIQAAETNVTVTTDPPLDGANGVTLVKRGEWLEVWATESFEIHATGKVQVGQYLVSMMVTEDATGDPSLILPVPAERWRDTYALMVPSGYATNWITITKTPGATVSMPTGPIAQSEFQSFGSGAYEYAYVELTGGFYKVSGSQAFGLTAYGFNGAVSYGYTGGMKSANE